MNAKTNGAPPTKRRALTAAVCSVIVAVVGGGLISAPAYASGTTPRSTCATTQLLSTNGSGVVDVSSGGLTIRGLNCATPTAGDTSTPTPATTATTSTTTPQESVSAPPTDDSTSAATTAPATVRAASKSSGESETLSNIRVQSSTDAVYPVKDGYRDDVRFQIRALSAAGRLVTVQGTAILSRAGRVAQSWTLDTPTSVLSWDGRVGGKIQRGTYTLLVTLYSPDGATRTTKNRVRVVTKHAVQQAVVVDSAVHAGATSASMPSAVMKAYANGRVTVRLITVAKVHGPAKVIFTSNGVRRSLTLRDGTHTGPEQIVPRDFEHVTITHKWAKGVATLKSVKAIWTYYRLVK